MICVADGVDGEVVDDTAGGHIRVSLRVNVGVTFPRLPGPELCAHTHTHIHKVGDFQLLYSHSSVLSGVKLYLGAR